MKSIVLLRHGESVWNKENRFTGWTDVDLTEKGVAEAYRAGNLLKEKGYVFNKAYTSYLKRAVKTLNCVLDRMDQDWIPVEKSWRLNEKHYGSLQGLNKSETAQKYGDEQVLIWRRSYDIAPLPLSEGDPRNPRFDIRYKDVPDKELPRKHYCGRERRTNFTRTYRRRRTSVRHRVQTILPGIVRLRLPICNSTRIRGDRTRRDDVAVGKPKIPSSGHVPEITPLHDCPQ